MRIPEEEITLSYSEYPEELLKVADKTYELMLAIKELRDKYRKARLLPLFEINSEFENLNNLVDCIEVEVRKFVAPGTLQKKYVTYSPEELKSILEDEEALMETGLDEWVKEGLL